MKSSELKIKGMPIEDALKPLRISISAEDVGAGALKDAGSCAAAVALMRQTGCTEARVHVTRTYLKKGKKWLRYYTPPALRSELVAFDRGGTFEPGEYKLEAVLPSHRKGERAKRPSPSPKARNGNRTGLRRRHVTTGIRQRMESFDAE